ncbi:MAG: DUF5110 domain-containing protein, partial [Bacteroides sp.]
IPLTNPNNNVSEINKNVRMYELYPYGTTSFVEYDDDGTSEAYKLGQGATTRIESVVDNKGRATITLAPTTGSFDGFVKEKATEFTINVTQQPKKVWATIGRNKVKLVEAASMEQFMAGENTYFYDATPNLNKFATKGSEFEKVVITKNPQVRVKLAASDITAQATVLHVEGFVFAPANQQRLSSGALTGSLNAQVTPENTEAYTLKPTWNKIANADYYEIEFNGMLYTTIKDTELLFDGLSAETPYRFKLRAVNKDGYSDWAEFGVTTKSNPLEFAIQGIEAETSAKNQGGFGVDRLFNFDESGDNWHTKYRVNAMPIEMVIDLKTVNQLDKFHYLPRTDGGNGTLLKGSVAYSTDKENWTEAGAFTWERNGDVKVFSFSEHPSARYIKLLVTEGVGNYGSGWVIFLFKVPGNDGYLKVFLNNDGKIDKNDLTSYTNYTGLRKGDADFEGYISNGDINKNDLIDAYDISIVATQLTDEDDSAADEEEANEETAKDSIHVGGTIELTTAKKVYAKDETIDVLVKGINLSSVNAISFALPYNQQDYEFVGIQPLNMKKMENLTNDRLHTDGSKVLYPTFVNVGRKEALEGSADLFVLKLKAKRKVTFGLKPVSGFLIDKQLNTHKF